jgi:hypothetical protein
MNPWCGAYSSPLEKTMAASAVGSTFNQDLIESVIIRWRLAEEYVTNLVMGSLPAEHALLVLIRRDVPSLLKEIIRLRPDLQ